MGGIASCSVEAPLMGALHKGGIMKSVDIEVEVVDIRKVIGDGNLKAFADVKVADGLIIKGFTVMKGKSGVFVSMPRRPGKGGQWFDTITPTSESVKDELESKVLEAYDRETDGVKD